MAPLFLQLNGASITVSSQGEHDVARARRDIAQQLKHPATRVQFIVPSGFLYDSDSYPNTGDGDTVVYVHLLPDHKFGDGLADIIGTAAFEDIITRKTLNVRGKQIKQLPSCFGDLATLQQLHLDHNQLTTLPESFGGLTSLSMLMLANNALTLLPDTFGNLVALRSLTLRQNELLSLPRNFGKLKALEMLDVAENRLMTLPDDVCKLVCLRVMNLSDNRLSVLPEQFGQLTALQSLVVNLNILTALPGTIGQLSRLRSLDVHKNQLTELPGKFEQLHTLRLLDLRNNQFSLPPPCLSEMRDLLQARLDGNPLVDENWSIDVEPSSGCAPEEKSDSVSNDGEPSSLHLKNTSREEHKDSGNLAMKKKKDKKAVPARRASATRAKNSVDRTIK